jgi:hypothetical protein
MFAHCPLSFRSASVFPRQAGKVRRVKYVVVGPIGGSRVGGELERLGMRDIDERDFY